MAVLPLVTTHSAPPSLVTDHFVSPEACNRILRVFRDCLRDSDPNTTLIPPVQGATGFTFLCSMETDEEVLDCVLKWQNSDQARNEALCTEVVRKYGFSTPKMLIIEDPTLVKELARFAIEQRAAMPPVESKGEYPLTLIAMNLLKAVTFKEAIKTGAFFRLPPSEQEEIFSSFGKMIVFDLLIGNDDRIIRIEKELSDEALQSFEGHAIPLAKTPVMNYGNVMLEFARKEPVASLRQIHFIDSASNPNLCKGPQVEEEFPSFGLNSFFDGEDETQQEADAVDYEKQALDHKARYDRLFSSAFQKVFSHPEAFAEHALASISRAIEEVTSALPELSPIWQQMLAEKKEGMIQALLLGIKEGIKTLLLDQGNLIKGLDLITDGRLKLIRKNIEFLTRTRQS